MVTKQNRKKRRRSVVAEPVPQYRPFQRITFDPKIMAGQACIRGMRVPVSLIVSLVARGKTVKEIMTEYPDLETEDIAEALHYASE